MYASSNLPAHFPTQQMRQTAIPIPAINQRPPYREYRPSFVKRILFFMGFRESEGKEVWQQYRDQFPVVSRFVYLNHAGVAPLCKPAADAMKALADDVWQFGSYHYDAWLEAYGGVRKAAATLIGSSPGEIAIVKNTSEGVATVALGIDWKPGDRIVCFTEEFPANLLPWKRLERHGVV